MHHGLVEHHASFKHFHDASAQIPGIINARVMLAHQFELTIVKHVSHALGDGLALLDVVGTVEQRVGALETEHLLEVDPSAQVARHLQALVLSLSLHLVAIKVATGSENEF